MEWTLVKLLGIFVLIVVILRLGGKLWHAMLASILGTILLYGIAPARTAAILLKSVTMWSNLSVLLILYAITFLQRLLERRQQLKLAYQDLSRLFGSNRISATVAPIMVGMLPSSAAVIICGDIVSEAVGEDLSTEEKAFVTSYFRHIPEAFLPTYSAVIIMAELSGVHVGRFVLGMLPVAVLLYALGWIFYVRKIQTGTGVMRHGSGVENALSLVKHLWTLLVTILLIVVLDVDALAAVALVTVVAFFAYGFRAAELPELAVDAFEPVLIWNSLLILIFKDFLAVTGVVEALPVFFARFPIPNYYMFALIFFFGTLICGANTIVAFCTTMAFATVEGAGTSLMVLLMCASYAAMQVTPVHICLTVVADYFKCSVGGIIRKTLPVIVTFLVFIPFYYQLLRLLGV